MSDSKFKRWSGLAAVVAGVSGPAVTIVSQTQPSVPEWLSIVSLLTSLIALTGIYQHQKEANGTQGPTGFILALVGSVLINLGVLIELTGMIYAIGLVLIALASFKIGQTPKWIPSMWIASPLIGFTGVLLSN
ncbi:MAG: hypothetical protein N2C13_00850, partial [Chloroflexota bacterium]